MIAHESARGHATGSALYTDDLAGRFPGLLHAWPVLAPLAHGVVASLDLDAALTEPGVCTILTAEDVPGEALKRRISGISGVKSAVRMARPPTFSTGILRNPFGPIFDVCRKHPYDT